MREVGGYELLEELGRGGMGVVYRAFDPRRGREVAVKLLLGLNDPEEVERFEREGRALSELIHPAILPVLDAGQDQGHPFLVSPLAADSLAAQLRRGPLPPARAAELTAQLARGLEHAHATQILHRDLKPANVLLDEQGQPLLADFGLARFLAERTLTASGAVLGTPSYMSPEQARGERADLRSEVYGLGAILYTALTGRPPFRAASPLLTLAAVNSAPLPPVRSLAPAVPPTLAQVCERALAKDPSARYSTVREFAQALESWQGGEVPAARRTPALIALSLVALMGVSLALRGGGEPAPANSPSSPRASAPPGPELAAQARRLLDDERCRQARALLAPLLEQDQPPLEVLLLAAEAANMDTDPERSLALSERALARDPACFEAWSWRIRSLIDLLRGTAAHEALRGARPHAKTAHERGCWHALRALLLSEENRYSEAKQAAREALALDEEQIVARLTLVNLELMAGRFETILGDLTRILAKHPRNLDAHWARALVYRETGRPKEAIAALDTCLEIDPNQPYCLAAKASLLLGQQQGAAARALLERVLMHPLRGPKAEARADALLSEGFPRECLRSLEVALEQSPTALAWVYRLIALLQEERLEQAKEAFAQAMRLVGRGEHEFPAALASVLRAYAPQLSKELRRAALSWAMDFYAEQLERTPEDDFVRRERAVVAKQLQRWELVLADLDRLLAKEREPVNEFVRTQALNNLGKYEEALAQARSTLERWPEQRKTRLLAATLLFRLGDLPAAKAYLEEVQRGHHDETALEARRILTQMEARGY
ncbi:MAG TPA: hypothetical protein DEA08_39485 [Planctomycetes bacterium]|nr:hypothetical protein [Planctomycetota bacterium]